MILNIRLNSNNLRQTLISNWWNYLNQMFILRIWKKKIKLCTTISRKYMYIMKTKQVLLTCLPMPKIADVNYWLIPVCRAMISAVSVLSARCLRVAVMTLRYGGLRGWSLRAHERTTMSRPLYLWIWVIVEICMCTIKTSCY